MKFNEVFEGRGMTVKQIVREYLEKSGYDGLCGEYCGCSLNDFMPCDGFCKDCVAAYAYEVKYGKTCEDCENKNNCPFESDSIDITDLDLVLYESDIPLKCRVNKKEEE